MSRIYSIQTVNLKIKRKKKQQKNYSKKKSFNNIVSINKLKAICTHKICGREIDEEGDGEGEFDVQLRKLKRVCKICLFTIKLISSQ